MLFELLGNFRGISINFERFCCLLYTATQPSIELTVLALHSERKRMIYIHVQTSRGVYLHVVKHIVKHALKMYTYTYITHVQCTCTYTCTSYFSARSRAPFSMSSLSVKSPRQVLQASFRSESLVWPESRLSWSSHVSTRDVPRPLMDSRVSCLLVKPRCRSWRSKNSGYSFTTTCMHTMYRWAYSYTRFSIKAKWLL